MEDGEPKRALGVHKRVKEIKICFPFPANHRAIKQPFVEDYALPIGGLRLHGIAGKEVLGSDLKGYWSPEFQLVRSSIVDDTTAQVGRNFFHL